VADNSIAELAGAVRDYLVRGGLDEDARYYLGPDVYGGLSRLASLGNFIGPGADVKDIASESAGVMEGDPAAFVGLPAALAMMALPGSKSGVEEVIDKNIVKQLREQNIPDPKTGRFPADKPVRGDFMTEQGSTYEWFDDATTQRYRVPHKPNDKDVGLQPVSGKTVFADPKDVELIGGMFQNPEMATRLDPIFDDAGKIEGISLRYLEDYGPRKAGETIQNIRVKINPEVGKTPIEIADSISPKGSRGNVHFGNRIVEVNTPTPIAKADKPTQAISSADTSLRQVPALFKKQDIDFPEGGTNFDIGGGRFDEGTKYLADERGVENFVYDPYNRSPEHNAAVMDRMRTKAADTATAANVLNVIAEPEARADVIRQAIQNIKPGGTAYFQIYEGAGTGVGKVTSKGFQNNKKTADYIGEVEEIFGPDNVRRKGNVIIATKPVEYRRGGSVVERSNKHEPKAI